MMLIKNIKQFLYNYFFVILMIVFYITESISKYHNYYHLNKSYLPRNIKIITIIILSSYIFYKKKWIQIRDLLILTILFFTGQLFLKNHVLSFTSVRIIFLYLFSILLLEAAFIYFNKEKRKVFFKYFEYLLILNSILIIIGFLFNIHLLKTYGKRFGFNGLFISSATSTYFYIIAIFYLFVKRNKSIYFLVLSILTLISILLVGTKSILLFSILLIVYISMFKVDKQKKFISILFTIIISISIVFYFIFFEPIFIEIFHKKGLLTSMLSYRDVLLKEQTIPHINQNWSFVNYLFGGISNTANRSQLGFIDLFLTFGFIGSVIYIYTYIKSLVKIKINTDIVFFIISLGIIIALGGNFFFSATITIYLVIIQQILIHIKNE